MYEQFFGLTEKPFSIQPDPSFLYWGRTHRLAYAMLEYGVLNHAGISVITGEVGCGKTTLIHRLLDQLSQTHTVALLSNIQEGRGDLLSWVLMGFGQSFAGKSHVELFAELQSFFISEYAKNRRVVLVIDEAQNLSADMLEELRMLSNINAGKDQLLQLILVGQPQLKGLLNKPELLQLAQRIGADFHLTPLNKEEVHAYIETRLAIAGCRRRIFTDRAMDFISEQSKGVPRVINIIADTALVYAFSAEELVVGVETIRNVVRDKMEFGVFGIASDDMAAAPLKPEEDTGMDAFADVSGTDKNEDSPKDPYAARLDESVSETAPRPAPKKPAPAKKSQADSEPQTELSVAVRADRDDKKAPRAKDTGVDQEQSEAGERRRQDMEASALTGVIVTAETRGVSPEAAIRSAGDGRAIVFVCDPANTEARDIATRSGAIIAECAQSGGSTPGRLRNAGYRQLKKIAQHIEYVQFLDAGNALGPDWIPAAEKFMARRPEVSMIEGRATRQHTLSKERDAGSGGGGEAEVLDGEDAFVRAEAFEQAGGFRGDLPVKEMADLSVRLRKRGGRVWLLPAVMTLARPRPRSFGGWWRAKMREGYGNAFAAALHGAPPERLGVSQTFLAVGLGFLFPFVIIGLALALFALAPALYPQANPIAPSLGVLAIGVLIYSLMVLASLAAGKSESGGLAGAMGRVFQATPAFIGACRFWLGKRTYR